MCDLLWSDPEDVVDGWALSLRDTDFLFGNTNISLFNHTNNTDYICRAHQLVMEGGWLVHGGDDANMVTLLQLWRWMRISTSNFGCLKQHHMRKCVTI
ncbi:hypothetical protein ERO13_D05G386750v2 [Gossypium hirsutum]|uniref:Serine/threonine specific protein phosphatases domain-containing protein n=1 Tax=Gossypium darwinii TaxID=34276 RepID=A0A5D2CRB7_GOSDA|nr:hypothetical protein ERO13_D05G386750v2 [Gossypium hirsutum]TYG72161.1 hypothetical protein ES288_D05G457800v1 [Gossypium darwinii]